MPSAGAVAAASPALAKRRRSPRRMTTGLRHTRQWLTQSSYWLLPAALTFGIASWGAGRPSLWTDEFATLSAASRSTGELFDLLNNRDAVMAPYYLIVHMWVSVFGTSELALRMPSILPMAAASAVTAILGRRMYDRRVGLIAGLLLAVLPATSRTAQEARSYAGAVFLAALLTLILLIAMDRRKPRVWLAYGLCTAALGFAHLLALTLLVVHAAALAQRRLRTREPGLVRQWLVAAGLGVAATLPIAWLGHDQQTQISWLHPPAWTDAERLADTLVGSVDLGVLLGLLMLASVFAWSKWSVLLVSWAVVPTGLLVVVSPWINVWHPRYVLFCAPAVALVAAHWLAGRHWLVPAFVFALIACLSWQPHTAIRRVDAHYGFNGPAVARVFAEHHQPGDVVLYNRREGWSGRMTLEYYVPAANRPHDVLAVRRPETWGQYKVGEGGDVKQALAGVNRVWVVRWWAVTEQLWNLDPPKADLLRAEFHQTDEWEMVALSIALFERN